MYKLYTIYYLMETEPKPSKQSQSQTQSYKSDALRVFLNIDTTDDVYSSFFTERQFKYYSDSSRCGMGMKQAKEQLQRIATYRKEYSASAKGCELCTDTKKQHSIRCIGKGNHDAILYMSPGNAMESSVYHVCKHMLREVDTCFDLTDSFVWVMNFKNYSYEHIVPNTTITYHFAKWLNDCLHERIRKIVMICPPKYFYPVIYLAKSLVKNEISDKLEIIHTPELVDNILSTYLTPEQIKLTQLL